jgi:fluoride exporter
MLCVLVGLGAALGSVLRFLTSYGATAVLGAGYPWGTLTANVLGSFVIGCYATLTGPGGRWPAGNRQRQFVMTGICGGFTTFSLFSLETLQLAQTGGWRPASANVAVSALMWLAGVWLGYRLALRIMRTETAGP